LALTFSTAVVPFSIIVFVARALSIVATAGSVLTGVTGILSLVTTIDNDKAFF
jgi:hypothetical protein